MTPPNLGRPDQRVLARRGQTEYLQVTDRILFSSGTGPEPEARREGLNRERGPAAWAPPSADYVFEADLSFQRGIRRVQGYIPGLVTHNAVGCDTTPPLERLYR